MKCGTWRYLFWNSAAHQCLWKNFQQLGKPAESSLVSVQKSPPKNFLRSLHLPQGAFAAHEMQTLHSQVDIWYFQVQVLKVKLFYFGELQAFCLLVCKMLKKQCIKSCINNVLDFNSSFHPKEIKLCFVATNDYSLSILP